MFYLIYLYVICIYIYVFLKFKNFYIIIIYVYIWCVYPCGYRKAGCTCGGWRTSFRSCVSSSTLALSRISLVSALLCNSGQVTIFQAFGSASHFTVECWDYKSLLPHPTFLCRSQGLNSTHLARVACNIIHWTISSAPPCVCMYLYIYLYKYIHVTYICVYQYTLNLYIFWCFYK